MRALNQAFVDSVLTDWRSAVLDARLQAAFAFLEQLVVPHGNPTVQHIQQLRAAGITDTGIEDIIYVCFAFNVLTRLADSFDFDMVTPQQMQEGAKNMLRFGYSVTSM